MPIPSEDNWPSLRERGEFLMSGMGWLLELREHTVFSAELFNATVARGVEIDDDRFEPWAVAANRLMEAAERADRQARRVFLESTLNPEDRSLWSELARRLFEVEKCRKAYWNAARAITKQAVPGLWRKALRSASGEGAKEVLRDLGLTPTPARLEALWRLVDQSDALERIGPEYARRWCEVYTRIQQCIDEETRAPEAARQAIGGGAH